MDGFLGALTPSPSHAFPRPFFGTTEKPDRLQRSLFQRTKLDKLALLRAINDCYSCRAPQMYRKLHNGQLSIKDFHVPFGGTLDTDNRWVIFSSLIPWDELEETYAPQFNPTTGAPVKPLGLAFGTCLSSRGSA
ncbi:MAG: hypothetical protein K9J75_12515 [Cyanobium usitatum Tobar12.5m-G36]|nr:hypothetical protein [Cyanobium usitatum Tobar12.5m-G36]